MNHLDPNSANDHHCFDHQQSLTLRTLTGQEQTLTGVTLTALSQTESPLGGSELLADSTSAAFSVPAAALGATRLHPGDTLLDAHGQLWRIVSVRRLTLGSRYQAQCLLCH